ncbi:AAA family ATPase, partial [Blastopirellula sp. JC732]
MRLTQQLSEMVRACCAGIWIRSDEHDDAIQEIAQLCRAEAWKLATWDIERGLRCAGESNAESQFSAQDPLAAIRSLSALADGERPTLLVLANFHRFLGSVEVVQSIARQVQEGKNRRAFVVILSPTYQVPIELERLFVELPHPLPDRQQLEEIAAAIGTEPGEMPEGETLQRTLDAASGLTRFEAEGAFSLALVRHGRIEPSVVWRLKAQTLLKNGLLKLHRGGEAFAELGGLTALKQFCLRALRNRSAGVSAAMPKGILLLGVPGTGKSAFAKALGNEVGRPTISLDIGALMGGIVGQTEERTRRALETIDAMQPSVVYVDEFEKGLSGVAGSGQSDSGVSSRMFGTLLSWLNDRTSDTFVVLTANDISKLPPEFARAERFDAVFFLDLPGREQKDAIWRMHLAAFGLDVDQAFPADKS